MTPHDNNDHLTLEDRAFIKVIARTVDVGDGWRPISKTLLKMVTSNAARHAELFELVGDRIRFSATGKIVLRYLA